MTGRIIGQYQFYDNLDANKSLYQHQSGFRLLHSVTAVLMVSTNDLYLNIDKGKHIGLTFVDLKKAFDMTDHEILFEKVGNVRSDYPETWPGYILLGKS